MARTLIRDYRAGLRPSRRALSSGCLVTWSCLDVRGGLAQAVEDLLVDPCAAGVDPHLVVLGAGPGVEVVEPELVDAFLDLGTDLIGDDDLLGLGGGGQVEVVEVEQPGELGDGVWMVVDPEIDRDVVTA